jgi:hypothetical protein
LTANIISLQEKILEAQIAATRTRLSMPRLFLHAEGLAIFAIALVLYGRGGYSWWIFLLLFFVPDLSFVFHAINQRVEHGLQLRPYLHFPGGPRASQRQQRE